MFASGEEELAMANEPQGSVADLQVSRGTLISDAVGLEREAALTRLTGPYPDALAERYRRAAAALRLYAESLP
jgi:hypothetical protein